MPEEVDIVSVTAAGVAHALQLLNEKTTEYARASVANDGLEGGSALDREHAAMEEAHAAFVKTLDAYVDERVRQAVGKLDLGCYCRCPSAGLIGLP